MPPRIDTRFIVLALGLLILLVGLGHSDAQTLQTSLTGLNGTGTTSGTAVASPYTQNLVANGALTMGSLANAPASSTYVPQGTFASSTFDAILPTAGVNFGGSTQPIAPSAGGAQIQSAPIGGDGGGITPMPEPSTWLAASLAASVVACGFRGRIRSFLSSRF